MGRSPRDALRTAWEILLQHAYTHTHGKNRVYLRVVVFTNYLSEIDILKRTFGGNAHLHGSGYKWTASKRDDLVSIVVALKEGLPSRHGFEDLILKRYMEKEKPD